MIFSQEFWRRRGVINWLLLPLAEIFGLVSLVRRELYRCGVFSAERAGVPVIVVGNIVAGGGGKTPIVIALVQALQARGLIPGVAARGVGGNNEGVLMVEDDTDWRRCGDEPLLVRRRTGAMVCVARRRINAVRQLSAAGCDVILCDDGLQHYALRRDMEICAVNGAFGLGNGWLLPAGPLRESCRRLDGETLTLVSQSGASVSMLPVEREGGLLRCGNVTPCVVVLNNDLSAGLPPMLRDLSVPIMPPLKMGWITRRKSAHFHQYRRAAEELAALLNADAWLLSADFSVCHKVDFQRREGMECLAVSVEETLRQISEKYRQHGVTDEPFVVLKADAGTYGMGIMSVRHADEVFNLNRRQRNKMSVGKEGAVVRDVLIQEGVNTLDDVGSAPAEPVVYMVGDSVVGGFYRANKTRGRDENLNSRGMSFSPLPFQATCAPSTSTADDAGKRLYVYGVIARLAGLAAARELEAANLT
jgi:glutamate--cysteine ligase